MTRSPRQFLFSLLFAFGLGLAFSEAAWSVRETVEPSIDTVTTWTPNIWQAIVLGAVQGLTEFLPISSTAHLKVVPELLGWGDPGVSFTAAIQLGSIVAVVWYFWSDLVQVFRGSWQAIAKSDYDSPDFRIAFGIALGTLPIVAVGLLVKYVFLDFYESTVRGLGVIAIVSIVMAILLAFAEQMGKRERSFDRLNVRDGILVGMAQMLALIPGVSRSGSTITAALFLGLERATAARFSFLLGIPAITLAGVLELKGAIEESGGAGGLPLLAGLISTVIFSYGAIAWLIRYLQTQNAWVFVWYRLAFGAAILIGMGVGAFSTY